MRVSEQRAIIREYCKANDIVLLGSTDYKNTRTAEDINKFMLRESDNTLFVHLEDNSYVTAYSIEDSNEGYCDERLAQNFN